jgi:hypothetical protein
MGRQQTTLLPECLDDWVDESNPVRAVDVFVDASIRAGLPKIGSSWNRAPTKSGGGPPEAVLPQSLTKVVDMNPDIECTMSVPLNSQ